MENIDQISFTDGREGLKEARKQLDGKFKLSTSLGAEDQVLTHWIYQDQLDLDIFTLDTGRLFESTYEVLHKTIKKYKLKINTYLPDPEGVKDFVNENGVNGFYDSIENRKSCCHIRKVIPLQKALQGVDYWVSGLRKEQSDNRDSLKPVMWDDKFGLWKIYPLLDWTWDDVLAYLDENNVPYNRYHKKGYPSIGCAPCTRAIEPGEDFRAGRWWWEQSQKECGLHSLQENKS